MTRFSMMLLAACAVAGGATGASATEFTGSTGGGQSFSNMQPSLTLSQYVQTQGFFPNRGGGTPFNGYLGQIRTFAYQNPAYLAGAARGGTLPINQNTALYSVLGPYYGGDGVRTFALPDLSGAIMVGAGSSSAGSGTNVYNVGQSFGSNRTSLTAQQMPLHDHDLPGSGSTGVAGGPASVVDDRQASLAITYGIVADGSFLSANARSAPIGQIQSFAGTFLPNGLLAADGRQVAVSEYQALFSLIGTTYGGDGVQFFRLPDLSGRTAVGANNDAATDTQLRLRLGETVGADYTSLTEANLPTHTHSLPGGGQTEAAGNGQAFGNAQPSTGINYIINLNGVYPSQDRPASDEYMLGEVIAYAANLLPNGWVVAAGRLLSIAENNALFNLLGTTYGGDGNQFFRLPDLRGRTVVGAGTRDGVTYQPGQVSGTALVQLTTGNLPSHAHALPAAVVTGVPEPAAWTMMIGGFGLVGGAARRRRRTAVTYA